MTEDPLDHRETPLDLQGFLDSVGQAAFDGDLATYLSLTERPYSIITADRTRVLETEDEMAAHLHRFRAGVLSQRLTQIVFILRTINMISPTLATGTYVTHLMRNAERIVDPYTSLVILRHRDGAWRAVSTIQTIGHADWNSRIQPQHSAATPDRGSLT